MTLKLDWDDPVLNNIRPDWLQILQELQNLNYLSIPRHVFISENPLKLELHEFSDASQNAYGACVYASNIVCNGKITVHLFGSKSRVTPIKFVSIPRLELCGATLLSRLMAKIKQPITVNIQCYYWTDSEIVLNWIKTESKTLQIFDANRVSEIEQNTDINNRKHVQTKDNQQI